MTQLPITADTSTADAVAAVEQWVATKVPAPWRAAAADGPSAVARRPQPRGLPPVVPDLRPVGTGGTHLAARTRRARDQQ